MNLPNIISTGWHRGGHIQGIALDRENGYLYCSFTTELVKYDLNGNLIGSVKGLTGHLGCLAFGPDGRVYGSLEFKNDSIGQGIRRRTGAEFTGNAFYAAIFDGTKITRQDMDACADGVMTTVYLAEVVADYEYEAEQPGGGKLMHRYGCAGIDGITFAPLPGCPDGKLMLTVACGVYGDISRADNDHQVLLAYDTEEWDSCARPLDQENIHTSGPDAPVGKYFIYTGNTRWGVQNLEYDAEVGRMYMAVYTGQKPIFPNYPMFIADWTALPARRRLTGFGDGTEGDVIPLCPMGMYDADSGVFGWTFPYGSTGMICLGGGEWYFSVPAKGDEGYRSDITLYRRTGEAPDGFVKK